MGWGEFFAAKKKGTGNVVWRRLDDLSQLDGILSAQTVRPQLIFKHSTRCSISSMALERFEREWDSGTVAELWLLDLLHHRDISNAVAERTGVMHQSPQLIVVTGGEVMHVASHSAISAKEVAKVLTAG
ncbi:MAG: bacillithiol system redox-active protein YtxJ [Flavobacteriales bacterium]|nr:bacillithiol system redox-active protein YtxJ [Flavobacteriales bacterium]